MYFQPHSDATCPHCGSDEMRFGTKEEVTGYKVYYQCDDCSDEWMTGKVMKADIERDMDITTNAKAMSP